MKKQIFLATVLAFGVFFTTEAQEYLSIEMNDNTVHEFRVTDIKEVKIRVSEEDPNCPIAEAIDLGLPSGTKWASWNVGATNPEEYGGFFAWGETEEKSYYDWSTYSHSDGSNETCNHIGDDIAGTSYDVAHVKWGGNWTMPTRDQIEELINNCTHTWTTRNRVKGWQGRLLLVLFSPSEVGNIRVHLRLQIGRLAFERLRPRRRALCAPRLQITYPI